MPRSRLLGPLVLVPAALAAGASGALWLWRRWGYPVRTHQRDVLRTPDSPVPQTLSLPGQRAVQSEDEGVGPRFHRTYRVTIQGATVSPPQLIARIQADLQAYVPDELARVEKVNGDPGVFAVGDEFDIHISSPWDGPVRVVESDETSFAFTTLEGHMEAGQIRFLAEPHEAFEQGIRFTIESWARSRDRLVDLVYDDLKVAQAAQQAMWTYFCTRVAEASGGEAVGEVEVITERERDPS